MDSLQQNKHKNIRCKLFLLLSSFTILTSLIGAAFFVVTYIPLSHHQIHGKEAIIIYKSINILGLALVPLAFAIGVTGAICIVVFKHKLASPSQSLPPPPPPPKPQLCSLECRVEGAPMSVPRLEMQETDYEYMNELVLAFVREKRRGKEEVGRERSEMTTGKIIDF
ncbi:uncharacterized protein A4U43_C07F4640 [Asparagus officinalis]|uniref:Uncharacterized protein n=1 Tax=Asparagus officinalis TaxID=4686 RepID=A0A5P1E9D3_ASPOF|nr:uncharacterized protein A4U43_C07F4640 [Asparagus officinalis]